MIDVTQKYWFRDDRRTIYVKHLGLSVSSETLKQIAAHEDGAPMAEVARGAFLWRLHSVCEGEPDQDRAARALLAYGHLSNAEIKAFLDRCGSLGLVGAPFLNQLREYAEHRDVSRVTVPSEDWQPIADGVMEKHKDRDATGSDKEKLANWLVGQVMKLAPKGRGIDVSSVKEYIRSRLQ